MKTRSINLRSLGLAAAFSQFATQVGAGIEHLDKLRAAFMRDMPRVGSNAPRRLRAAAGYIDRAGMPHFKAGDKLKRKALTGKVGLTHARGPYAALLAGRPNLRMRRQIERLDLRNRVE